MGRFSLRSRVVQRTCRDCGETWTLEASLAHMHASHHTGFGIGGRESAGQQIAWDRASEASASFDQELETLRQLRTCPKCGSDHYKDRRPWRSKRAD